jgi:hypothetical protein
MSPQLGTLASQDSDDEQDRFSAYLGRRANLLLRCWLHMQDSWRHRYSSIRTLQKRESHVTEQE